MNLTYARKRKTRNYKISDGLAKITPFGTDVVYFIYMRIKSVVKTKQFLMRCLSENISPFELLVKIGY